jgi:glycosyltransferase involved in cell wall biosynthesis
MASGLPIVSSNVGAIPEILGTQNLIVSPKIDNVVTALHKLLTCDDLRKKLRYRNRERSICRFNALTQSLQFEEAINRA